MTITKKCVAWLLAFCLLAAGLPAAAPAISIQEEEALSKEFLKVLRRHFQMVEDPVVTAYVNAVGQRILSSMPPQPFTYRFYVVEQDVFNAFATPAGHIFVFSGLLEAMEREEELAGILAHEIAHVECRHISDKIERSKKANMMTLAGTIAGILLGVGGMGDVGQAVAVGSAAASQSQMLAYSRQDETQADQLGIEHMIQAGYNGDGLVSVLEKIRAQTWFGPKEVPSYLMTHPAVDDRIVGIKSQVEVIHRSQGRPSDEELTPFIRAQARLVTNPVAATNQLKRFENEVKARPDDPMARYRYGLLLAKVGRREASVAELRAALAQRAFDPAILSDLGRIHFMSGNYGGAISILETVVQMAPGETEGRYYLGRSRMETGDFSGAAEAFELVVRDNPGYTDAYFHLGKCYDRLGRRSDALYALGTHYFKKGEYRKATFQLEKALEAEPSGDRSADIQALLEDIRAARDEKTREELQEEKQRERPGTGSYPG